VTFLHEHKKVEERLPAARAFIRDQRLNETFSGDLAGIGVVVMGGLTNSVLRAPERLELADVFGTSRVPVHCLNVVYPLVPEELHAFCVGKRAAKASRGRLPTSRVLAACALPAMLDRIEVDDHQIRPMGRKDALEQAVLANGGPVPGVRSFVRGWRSQQDAKK
jgi:hypothetical protein